MRRLRHVLAFCALALPSLAAAQASLSGLSLLAGPRETAITLQNPGAKIQLAPGNTLSDSSGTLVTSAPVSFSGGSSTTFSNGLSNATTIHSLTVNNPQAVGGVGTNSADTQLTTTWSAFEFQLSGTETGSALINIKKDAGVSSTSTIEAHLYSNNAGVPGSEISSSQVPDSPTGLPTIVTGAGIGTGYALIEFRLPYTGLTNGGLYWVVIKQVTSGGNFYLGSAASGANAFATAADSGGSPGSWSTAAKTVSGIVYGSTGRGIYISGDNHYNLLSVSTAGFAVRGLCTYGLCGKFDSIYNIGVGGTSTWNVGARGSSINNIAVAGDSLGTAGGQFQCSVGAASGCIGTQVVSQDGPALQSVPQAGGLIIDGRDGSNSNAQVFTVTHDGQLTLKSIASNSGGAMTMTTGNLTMTNAADSSHYLNIGAGASANQAKGIFLVDKSGGNQALLQIDSGGSMEFQINSHNLITANTSGTILNFGTTGQSITSSAAFAYTISSPTYGTTVSIDASQGNQFTVTATNGTAFTIAAPSNPTTGQLIDITIRNTSGGALGAVTWNSAFKMASWTSPATANSRSIAFFYDGTNWIERARTSSDIPN